MAYQKARILAVTPPAIPGLGTSGGFSMMLLDQQTVNIKEFEGVVAKNAILIVEFAKERVDIGMNLIDATLDAVKLRLRPIIMTSLAFILGIIPLMLSTGAGAVSRQTIGWTVFGALLILDGLGYGKQDDSNAVIAANTPYLDYLLKTYPNAKLEASGEAVGLPEGQMDGRDTDPNSGIDYVKDLQEYLTHSAGTLASAIGRYYAMDRDNRWERVKETYDLLVNGTGTATHNIIEAIQQSYDNQVTDEFVKPIVITNADGTPKAVIKPGDVVICYISEQTVAVKSDCSTQKDFPE
ncbi:hypothetical protein FQR65_LT15202 [Abscondita terminalis]|nr:hypothetical protein FQR65_LT15202 [Abscondita terminalis]